MAKEKTGYNTKRFALESALQYESMNRLNPIPFVVDLDQLKPRDMTVKETENMMKGWKQGSFTSATSLIEGMDKIIADADKIYKWMIKDDTKREGTVA